MTAILEHRVVHLCVYMCVCAHSSCASRALRPTRTQTPCGIQLCFTNLHQRGPRSSSSPTPTVTLVSKRGKGEGHTHSCTHRHTHVEHGSQPAEIIHLDICACVLLGGEIGERERGNVEGRRVRYEGEDDGQQKA